MNEAEKELRVKLELRNLVSGYLTATNRARQEKMLDAATAKIMAITKESNNAQST